MALIDGTPAVLDNPFPYTVYNKLKDHWYGLNAPTDPQNGMVWVKNDGTSYFYHSAAWHQFYPVTGESFHPFLLFGG